MTSTIPAAVLLARTRVRPHDLQNRRSYSAQSPPPRQTFSKLPPAAMSSPDLRDENQHPQAPLRRSLDSVIHRRLSLDDRHPSFSHDYASGIHMGKLPFEYEEKEPESVAIPAQVLDHFVRVLIADMEAYAQDWGLPYDENEAVPLKVFQKNKFYDSISFLWFCMTDTLLANPYRVPVFAYLASVGLLLAYMSTKAWLVYAKSRKFGEAAVFGPQERADLETAFDTTANTLPVLVTLLLFVFPPLITNGI